MVVFATCHFWNNECYNFGNYSFVWQILTFHLLKYLSLLLAYISWYNRSTYDVFGSDYFQPQRDKKLFQHYSLMAYYTFSELKYILIKWQTLLKVMFINIGLGMCVYFSVTILLLSTHHWWCIKNTVGGSSWLHNIWCICET